MYSLVLGLHSWLRWAALIVLVLSFVLALRGDNGPLAKKTSLFSLISFHLQLVFGLLLYAGLSPITEAAFADFGAAMKDAASRFWAVEHLTGMLLAVVLVSLGHILGKKAVEDSAACKRRMIFFGAGLLLTLLLIPWPFRAAGRALFWLG